MEQNNKISIQELTDLVAAETCFTKKFTEEFLRELVEVLAEFLEKDGWVKVKGLGSFRLQWIEARKSVDVATGREIVLPARYKVSFTPDAAMQEAINAPYAHLETVVMQPISEKPAPKPLASEAQASPSVAEEPKGTPQVASSPPMRPTRHGWMLPILVLFLVAVGVSAYITREFWLEGVLRGGQAVIAQVDAWFAGTDVSTLSPQPEQNVLQEGDSLPLFAWDSAAIVEWETDTLEDEWLDEEEDSLVTPENYTPAVARNAPVREEVSVIEGSRLTMVALRAYGNKAFWVYIYDANRDQLRRPGDVCKGMLLKIPDLPLSLVNPDDERCISKALELAERY